MELLRYTTLILGKVYILLFSASSLLYAKQSSNWI